MSTRRSGWAPLAEKSHHPSTERAHRNPTFTPDLASMLEAGRLVLCPTDFLQGPGQTRIDKAVAVLEPVAETLA
jgi:hypothetical protein